MVIGFLFLLQSKKADGGIICPYFFAKHHAEGKMSHKVLELKNYKVLCMQNASAIAKGKEICFNTTADLGPSQKKETS